MTELTLPTVDKPPTLGEHLHELREAHELLFTWARREFRVRYSQSVLGAGWAIIQPVVLMVVFSAIFSVFMKVPSDGVPYPVFSYIGLLPWTLFANTLTFAIPSLVNNMNLVSKIYFPREILPLASILVGLVDFLIAAVVFALMLLYYQIPVGPTLLLVPVILASQLVFTFGLSLFASAFNVFYRDVRFVIPLALQVWMYVSPVIYSTTTVPAWLRPWYLLNPMAAFIDAYRRIVLLRQPPDWLSFGLASLLAVGLTLLGYLYFKRAERQFADLI